MKGDTKFFATPYSNIPLIKTKEKKLIGLHSLKFSEVCHYPPCFRSKAFYIRYKDEKIKMKELCQFRAEVDVDWDHPLEDTEFMLDVKLKFH